MQDALEAQLAEAQAAHTSEVTALAQQLEDAHRLADYSSRELAGVVQQLAAVRDGAASWYPRPQAQQRDWKGQCIA